MDGMSSGHKYTRFLESSRPPPQTLEASGCEKDTDSETCTKSNNISNDSRTRTSFHPPQRLPHPRHKQMHTLIHDITSIVHELPPRLAETTPEQQ
jgi:hypothetical protein